MIKNASRTLNDWDIMKIIIDGDMICEWIVTFFTSVYGVNGWWESERCGRLVVDASEGERERMMPYRKRMKAAKVLMEWWFIIKNERDFCRVKEGCCLVLGVDVKPLNDSVKNFAHFKISLGTFNFHDFLFQQLFGCWKISDLGHLGSVLTSTLDHP